MHYYFIPQARPTLAEPALIELGLAHASAGSGATQAEIREGPGGAGGVLLHFDVPGEAPAALRYDAAAQTWKQAPGGKWWFGFEGEVQPRQLQRREICPGQAVALRGGTEWIIPRCYAVLPDRPRTLPGRLDLDEAGNWVAVTEDRYRQLCEDAWRVWQAWCGSGPELDAPTVLRIVAAALAVNYRVGQVEIAALGILGTNDVHRILAALIDADEVLARVVELKKKAIPQNGSAGTCSGVKEKADRSDSPS
jgi:hypothetical protein